MSPQAHKMMLAVTSAAFEGMFFGPLADKGLREVGSPPDFLDGIFLTTLLGQVRIEDLKPAGFRRLLHFIYNSRCLSWKIEEPEEWWSVLEAANKFLNSRLVEQVIRESADIRVPH